ncbi:Mur ligase family protein [Haloarcula litorea]|uniref:Mur ligase family protein n=1 Tax=Haloarcula litorea TaxID=3032579 RepID=UPI0023E87407|nr:Mur ligase family protein [Halomicroarcula sp. GDY20]
MSRDWREAVAEFRELASAAADRAELARFARLAKRGVGEALGAGPLHRQRLADIDTRIAVTGVRGKSSSVRWLHDAFHGRGYDTLAKVTGDQARVIHNGTTREVGRGSQVRLYENERILAAVADEDVEVAIFENQGIRQYTTRLVNEQFVSPDVIFLTNVREDHLDTLGSDRVQIARSLARSVPQGTRVVCGEPDERLRRYLSAELDRRDAPVTFVDPPERVRSVPGAEIVYGLDEVLAAVGEPPMPEARLTEYVESLRPSWRRLPNGRVFNAAAVNDVQSTELVRRELVGATGTVIEPLLNLRADRRGRTASFIRYLTALYESGDIERTHVVGDSQRLFDLNTPFPVRRHDTERESAPAVLDDALAAGHPVLLMGNTVTEFMRDLQMTIDVRALDVDGERSETATVEDDDGSGLFGQPEPEAADAEDDSVPDDVGDLPWGDD